MYVCMYVFICCCKEVFVSEGWTADAFDECEVQNMTGLSR